MFAAIELAGTLRIANAVKCLKPVAYLEASEFENSSIHRLTKNCT